MKIPFFGKKSGGRVSGSGEAPIASGGRRIVAGQLTKPITTLLGRYAMTGGASTIVPRRGSIIYDIDVENLKKFPASVLMKELNTISPETSMAIWTILRLCGTEFSWRVYDPSGKESVKGQAYIDSLMENLNPETGGVRNLLTQAFKTVYIQGACSSEVVLLPNLKDVKKYVMVDPATITFFMEKQGEGEMEEIVYVPKQLQNGKYISLEKEGFYYVPLDPDIGDPYGVSPIVSVVSVLFFYMRVLFDLNQVVHNQAWERLHVKILEEVLRNNVSDQLKRNDKKMRDFIDDQLGKISDVYNSLEPDDTFVTTDATEIKEIGGKNSGGTVSVKLLMDSLNRCLSNSLKVMSNFLNQHTGKTESYSTVEWMIQVAGIKSIRDVVKSMIDNALSFMLRVKGIPGNVEIEFPEISLDGGETLEKTKFYRSRRVLMERDAGIINHDHAANLLYDIPQAEGEEVSLEKSSNISESRALADQHRDGYGSLKHSRLVSIERAFDKELTRNYEDMAEVIIKRLEKEVEFED